MKQQELILDSHEVLDEVKTALIHSEQAIERAARNAFEEWGAQLKHIRDNRLYIAFEPGCTWERYTQERWEMTPQRAGQLIAAYEMLDELKPTKPLVSNGETTGFTFPSSERQIRPLSKLPKPEQRAEVWQRVIANANGSAITAKLVTAEVERYKAEQIKDWITLSEWNELGADEQNRLLTQVYQNDKTFNKTNDNIEWARWSWNPVTGCLHNCAYCYARDIAARFFPQNFEPSFLPSRLTAPDNTRPPDFDKIVDPVEKMGQRNVFVCSMADLFGKWVPVEWIEAVLDSIRRNPQWTFLLLSKFPIRMAEFSYPDNVWLGTSCDYQHTVKRAESAFTKIKNSGFNGVCWLSCEPLMENLQFTSLEMFDWVVMGGASKSTQTDEFMPPFDWIVNLYNQAKGAGCKIYQKTNLIPGMSHSQRVREYP